MPRIIVSASFDGGNGVSQLKLKRALREHQVEHVGTGRCAAELGSHREIYAAVRVLLKVIETEEQNHPIDELWLHISK